MKNKKYKKILILGSGALQIGQAGEFDYSGSQAIKALKEEGIRTILVNPNIATIQTSRLLADIVYFLPVTDYFVEQIIKKEKPDGILLSFGGQTALNCGISLTKKGILEKYHVAILGTPISAIMLTEDRQAFANHLATIHIPTPLSEAATSIEKAKKIAKKLGFPVMVRSGFSLGGQGSGIAKNMEELMSIVTHAFSFVPQVLVEQYLHHYKEIEYEVVRDKDDNCITVCNMENMDPLGIHTGESVVIAPSQTLTNTEYHQLRAASIKIVRSLGIVGECNVQFALNPKGNFTLNASPLTLDYFVIEVNARLSRSSALASKATGYPLAYVAAKLALGYALPKLRNSVTKVTSACFEPSLDYIVVKLPRWDMEKFKGAELRIGSSMKSVGEAMGIGRTFGEAYQKAIRMYDLTYTGAVDDTPTFTKTELHDALKYPTSKRMWAIAAALRQGITIPTLHHLTGIDPWFLSRIKNIVKEEETLRAHPHLLTSKLRHMKELGFSDRRIGMLTNQTGIAVRNIRKELGILPSVFQIDTLAAEFPAKTNYLYMTYNGNHHDVAPTGKNGVIVLGSGPYRIGSSVEFDWTSVSTVMALKKYKKKSIVINCNPETVSTDYDISDRLYFEEMSFERITDIYEFEHPEGIILSVGGQTPNNRAQALFHFGVKLLGTSAENIDIAEDRSKFSALCDTLKILQPAWESVSSLSAAEDFAKRVGYPVLIRPSYVLSGSAMNVCGNKEDLEKFLKEATIVSRQHPVTISRFYEQAKELEFDAVAQKGDIKAYVISEHIENAGVHSGDATVVLPTQEVSKTTKEKMSRAAGKIAKALHITGPFNIQFLAKNNEVLVIEVNVRASRTFPFISKVTGVNLMDLFVQCLFEKTVQPVSANKMKSHPELVSGSQIPDPTFVAVKVPQFSFSRLKGADPTPHVEMASTGEVACFGDTVEEAYLKGYLAVGGHIPEKGVFISLSGDEKKEKFLKSVKQLAKKNLPFFATQHTYDFLSQAGISLTKVYKIYDNKTPNVLTLIQEGKVDLVINIVDRNLPKSMKDSFAIRRGAIDANVSLFTKIKNARLFIDAITKYSLTDLAIKSWEEYE